MTNRATRECTCFKKYTFAYVEVQSKKKDTNEVFHSRRGLMVLDKEVPFENVFSVKCDTDLGKVVANKPPGTYSYNANCQHHGDVEVSVTIISVYNSYDETPEEHRVAA